MRNGTLALILCLGCTLIGCSSKPDIGDIDAPIRAMWKPCELLKVTDLKKINGVDQGGKYELVYSYKLEFLKDTDNWLSDRVCPIAQLGVLLGYAGEINKLGSPAGVPMKKGAFIEISDSATLVKSEKGWVLDN
jgi:hypothetical protein